MAILLSRAALSALASLIPTHVPFIIAMKLTVQTCALQGVLTVPQSISEQKLEGYAPNHHSNPS